MPQMTTGQLQKVVDEGQLLAVSLDTNVFDRFGRNLKATALLALSQFPAKGIVFAVTDIIEGEVISHIHAHEERVSVGLRDALKRYAKARADRKDDVDRIGPELGLLDDSMEIAQRRWADFMHATGAKRLTASEHLDPDALVRMYFETTPPFEAAEKKKAEFPDAIALLELETFGAKAGKYVLAVSKDKGWSDFAQTAAWLVVVEDLGPAVSLLHEPDGELAERALTLLGNDDTGIYDDVIGAIMTFVDGLNPEVEASSYMETNAEFLGAGLFSVEPLDPTSFAVIGSDQDSVTMSFEITIWVEVEAEFSFSVHDSIDDDYLPMGAAHKSKAIEITLPMSMKVKRGFAEDDNAMEVQIERQRPLSIDFGFVEPDGWHDEND